MITVALAKGRLADKTIEILEKCGLDLSDLKEPGRRLVFFDASKEFRFIFVKPTDVPTYVEYGAADLGVCGEDTLLEEDKNIYELLDLGLGKCKLAVAGYADVNLKRDSLRVATKYENVAKRYYAGKEQNIEIIKLSGSIELGPVIGLSDVILDIVESGKTLEENKLVVLEDVARCSARLAANKVSLKVKGAAIRPLVAKMKEVLRDSDL